LIKQLKRALKSSHRNSFAAIARQKSTTDNLPLKGPSIAACPPVQYCQFSSVKKLTVATGLKLFHRLCPQAQETPYHETTSLFKGR
jgi:hypothetical protein